MLPDSVIAAESTRVLQSIYTVILCLATLWVIIKTVLQLRKLGSVPAKNVKKHDKDKAPDVVWKWPVDFK